MNDFSQRKMSPIRTFVIAPLAVCAKLSANIAELGDSKARGRLHLLIYFSALLSLCASAGCAEGLPPGFAYARDIIPDLSVEMRYASNHNFVGAKIDGYQGSRCILTKKAAQALKKAQEDLKRFGLCLKVYDAYRPQQAVQHFVRWAQDISDIKTKNEFYPNVEKANLFRDGYIAEKSAHSRGSTVDLTIISFGEGGDAKELDMGTAFDYFGPESWPDHQGLSPEQRAHRLLLRLLMLKHGFQPYDREWWHFTLKREPFPHTYFDFPVQ